MTLLTSRLHLPYEYNVYLRKQALYRGDVEWTV